MRIYELLAGVIADTDVPPSPNDLRRRELTERAFAAYVTGDFRSALASYEELATAFPEDPIGALFVQRCKDYLRDPPGADWSGVTRMKEK